MKIEVTQEDIDRGVIESCISCPIALAVARAAKASTYVDGKLVSFLKGEVVSTSALPVEARIFVHEFDAGHADILSPFSFEINFG